MSNNDDSHYDLGYGKPPKHSRFKRGTSGNPKGRPKGSKNMETILKELLDETVSVNIQGKQQTLSRRKLIALQMVNKAIKGDWSAFKEVIKLDKEFKEKSQFDENGQQKWGVLVVNRKMDDNEWEKKYGEMKTPYDSENDPSQS